MTEKKLFWQIYRKYLFTILPVLIIVAFYTSSTFRDFYFEKTSEELERYAETIRESALNVFYVLESGGDTLSFCSRFDQSGPFRVTLILRNGHVICDSAQNPDSQGSP